MTAVPIAGLVPAHLLRTAVRARRAPRRLTTGTARTIGWITGAARAYDAGVARVAIRAARLRLRGWRVGDLALLGLLDPATGPAAERWAVRRREVLRLQEALNPAGSVHTTDDKIRFSALCEERGLPAVTIVAVLERRSDAALTARAWAAALQERAPVEMVVKPAGGTLATGVRILRRTGFGVADHAGGERSWLAMATELAQGPGAALVVQPRLRTHPELLRLTGRDVLQCLRVVTLLDEDGRGRVLYTALRIAVGDSDVDSFRAPWAGSTGNLIARVEEDGRLAAPVGVAPGGFGLVRVPRHPDTGLLLEGAAVPQVREARALAVRAAEAFAPLRTVGWDVAPTAEGPVLLEGNVWWGATGDPDGALLPVRAALYEAVAGRGLSAAGARPPRPPRARSR